MYNSLKETINYYYGLNVSIIRKLENGYLLYDNNSKYLLIEINHQNERILLSQLRYLPKLIIGMNHIKYFQYQNYYYCIYEYIEPSHICLTNQYLTLLFYLNEETLMTKKVDMHYYEKQCEQLRKDIDHFYGCFEEIIHQFINNQCLNVLFFPLIYEYESIKHLKQLALNYLKEYEQIVLNKNTCRFCVGVKQVNPYLFSIEKNCITDVNEATVGLFTDTIIKLFHSEIEYDDLERLYMNKISFQRHEKLYILIKLLCLRSIDFNMDGYKNIAWFKWFKVYVERLNKIMKSLQMDENIMYN